jgi:hypothetical protein
MYSLARAAAVPASASATLTEAEIWANHAQYAEAARGAFVANTERALRSDIALFTDWCRQEARQAMPASPEAVATFVDAMAAHKAPAAGIKDGALFRAVRHHGRGIGGALDPGAVARVFKTMAIAAELPPDKAGKALRVSGHSTRIGAAQDMLRYKETLAAIMAAGRWKSPEMVGRYVKEQEARDSAANRIAAAREPF